VRGWLELSKSHAARIYVDEAHGLGVLGRPERARRSTWGAGRSGHRDGHVQQGSGVDGRLIAGPRDVVNYLMHTARPFVFSASLPAASVAAAGRAGDCPQGARAARRLLRWPAPARGAACARFSVLDGETAIVPVVIREEVGCVRLCTALLAEGIYNQPGAETRRGAESCSAYPATSEHTEAPSRGS